MNPQLTIALAQSHQADRQRSASAARLAAEHRRLERQSQPRIVTLRPSSAARLAAVVLGGVLRRA